MLRRDPSEKKFQIEGLARIKGLEVEISNVDSRKIKQANMAKEV